MSVITISRGCYSKGKEVAEKLAIKLGYECISREIILEASENFHVQEKKLNQALHDSFSLFEHITYNKEINLCYIREALLEYIEKDNVVYHGLAGHFFLQGIPHVMKVRILANFQDRIEEEMRRENISWEKASSILKKDDETRKKWSIDLYGQDNNDSNLYDITLHIDRLKVDDAVEILYNLIKQPFFQSTPESKAIHKDLLLAAKVEAALIKHFTDVKVDSKDGKVHICINSNLAQKDKIIANIKDILKNISNIKEIDVDITPILVVD